MKRQKPLENGLRRKLVAHKYKPSTIAYYKKRAKQENVSETLFIETCIHAAGPTIRFAYQPVVNAPAAKRKTFK